MSHPLNTDNINASDKIERKLYLYYEQYDKQLSLLKLSE